MDMRASAVIGQPDLTTVRPDTTANRLFGPEAVTFDSSGNMWVADFQNSRVLEFKSPFTTGMSASIVIGQKDFTTSDRLTTWDGLSIPSSVDFDASGNLWVADSGNSRVLEFGLPFRNGMAASLVIGQTNFETRSPSTIQSGLSTNFDYEAC